MSFRLESYDKKAIVVFVLLCSVATVYYCLVSLPEEKKFEKNARYTIGKIIKTETVRRGGCQFYFFYRFQGKWYRGSASLNCFQFRQYWPDRKVFIKVSQKNPQDYRVLDEVELFAPDTMTAPYNGWESLP